MQDDNQIVVPPSFLALRQDAQGRLRGTPAEVRERYEWCEDMAASLVERAQQVYQGAPSEASVLQGFHAALRHPEAGLSAAEARWVTLRLAELLGWHGPALPAED
ncbi:hypothetical protein [Comamonas flocculans]|uniref:ATPase with chaperone activity n=1 Tax=Comamonas flocculans TaxID=2597701 RepID=A0A5B8RW04_9BURK|nr:hypothetical protein [Comamonas flocculans]QEA13711.1 hypothetical protein FOZ74_12090 [Comamonas flocculans]